MANIDRVVEDALIRLNGLYGRGDIVRGTGTVYDTATRGSGKGYLINVGYGRVQVRVPTSQSGGYLYTRTFRVEHTKHGVTVRYAGHQQKVSSRQGVQNA